MKSPNRKPVIVTVRGTGHVEIDLPSVPGFDGFKKLRQYLQNEHGAVVKECVEGPDACKSVLSLQSIDIDLLYDDPFGNSIQSVGPDINHEVEGIGRDLAGC